MNIVTAFLAESIEVTPRGFNLEGAFPVYVTPPELPFTMTVPIGFVVNLQLDELEKTFRVVITTRPSRREVLPSDEGDEWIIGHMSGEWADGAPLYLYQKGFHPVTFTETGPHTTVIWGEGGEALAAIPFYVQVGLAP